MSYFVGSSCIILCNRTYTSRSYCYRRSYRMRPLRLIPAKQVFSGLSNSTVVLFAGMFVVGASMFYTGLAQAIGNTVVKMCGTGENSLMFGLMLVGTVLSAVLSNTGTAACLLPVALGICSAAKIPASRQLMPLAFACGWGGIITMVGTPPNIIATGAMTAAGLEPFGFFEFAWIGVPVSVAGMLYMMFVGKYCSRTNNSMLTKKSSKKSKQMKPPNPNKSFPALSCWQLFW